MTGNEEAMWQQQLHRCAVLWLCVLRCCVVEVLKGHLPSGALPTDPCEYRLYEILQVYGSTFVALVSDNKPQRHTAQLTQRTSSRH